MIKLNKNHIIVIMCIIVATIILCVGLFIVSGEKERPNDLSIEKLYAINIYGTQGEGYVEIEMDEGYFEAFVIESGISLRKEDVAVRISKENNLDNGDSVVITFKDKDNLINRGVKLLSDKITYTVSELKPGTDFNVFKDLIIYLDEGEVMIDNSMCSNFIKDNVDFFIKNQLESYKEGDTVTVGAYVDMNAASDNGYIIEKIEQDFIISEQETTND